MKKAIAFLLASTVLLSSSVQAHDCVEKYQHRIEQADEWGRLTRKWPAQIARRKSNAQAMINLIEQSQDAQIVRFPGGEELVSLTYRLNRFRPDHLRVDVRQVALAVTELAQEQVMCPDFSNLMLMDDIARHLNKSLGR